MTRIDSPDDLLKYAEEFNGHGILVSGGFDAKGRLINLKKMLPSLRRMKNMFYIAMHPGFVNREAAKTIADACHAVFVELPTTAATKDVFGLSSKIEDYLENMQLLSDAGLKVSPHITLGLHYGAIEEYEVVDHLKELSFEKLVINMIVPTANTPFEQVKSDTDKVLTFVREIKNSGVPFAIGCMRPRYFDVPLLEMGVEEIANPSSEACAYAKQHNIPVKKVHWCCGISLDTIQQWESKKKEAVVVGILNEDSPQFQAMPYKLK